LTTRNLGAAAPRVPGWDLLRGLCAYAVASYHLLSWQQVADVYVLGLYGVYMFFVLSGASLAYNYHAALTARDGWQAVPRFFWLRFARLIPLYALVLLLSWPWMVGDSPWSSALALRLLANLSLSFGLDLPARSSLVVGGWSLGIEAALYLLFPLMLRLLGLGLRTWLALAALLVVQLLWISITVGGHPEDPAQFTRYHQIPAFAGYFFAGCVFGWMQLQAAGRFKPPAAAWGLVLAVGAVLMLWLSPGSAAAALSGWRGALLCGLSLGLVWWSGQVSLSDSASRWASHLGDLTYGVYLLHPVLYFGIQHLGWDARLGQDLHSGHVPTAVGLGLVLLLLTSGLAWYSERGMERPLRRWAAKLWPARISG